MLCPRDSDKDYIYLSYFLLSVNSLKYVLCSLHFHEKMEAQMDAELV